MKRTLPLILGLALLSSAWAFPLFPTITGHDFNFGAFNGDGTPEWSTFGPAPDILIYTPFETDTEVTAYWPFWPAPPVFPVFNLGGAFGGDFVMGVQFTGQDAPYVGPGGVIDVSLTGTGLDPFGPDLFIIGAIPALGVAGVLWALDLELVSLYGYSGLPSYVLEGVGTIAGGLVAEEFGLIGHSGVMRGHLDFIDAPPGWIPPLYDPTKVDINNQFRAAFSGETGLGFAVPEPATMTALFAGIALLGLRKRNRR